MTAAIHSVLQGPHNRPDLPEDVMAMICVAQQHGVVQYDFELYSDNFNWLYGIERYTKQHLEPYVLEENE